MVIKDLKCDFSYILRSENRDFTVLKSLESHCYNYCSNLATNVGAAILCENESKKKSALSLNQISELQQKITRLKSETDATKLQQKIVDKKISDACKQCTILNQQVHNVKSKNDDLSLEIIDLNQEREKRKEDKVLLWSALKRACYVYKEQLDLRITLLDPKEHECVQISFFTHNVDLKDKYFVRLNNSNNQWKVEKIQPTLTTEHLNDFKGIINYSTELEIVDITAFLCKLRHTFIKNYLNAK